MGRAVGARRPTVVRATVDPMPNLPSSPGPTSTAPGAARRAGAPVLPVTGDVVDLTRALCDIESVSGHEGPLADAVEAALRRADHLEVLRDGDTVVARTHLGRPRRVVVAGHLDTVPVKDNLPTRVGTLDGEEVVWGRGTTDMKGGVAIALKAAVLLTAPAQDVTWVFYDHEEVSADQSGLGRVLREHPDWITGDFAVLGEPSSAAIEGGCNGVMSVVATARGRRAHAGRAWKGVDAIHLVAPLLTRLAEYRAREVEVDGLVYRESLSATSIEGGVASNVIPDLCRVRINYRFAPSLDVAGAEAFLRDFCSGYEVEVVDAAPGARPGLDDPVAAAFVAAIGAEPKPKYGWTDVARFSAMGIPAVNFGPGDSSVAHTDDEFVRVSELRSAESALFSWLA